MAALSEEAVNIASIVGDDAVPGEELRAIVEDLRTDDDRAVRLLDELGRFPDIDVRLWAAGAAREVLGEGAMPLLLRMTKDRDIDVQDAAIEEVFALGPQAASKVVSDLRRKLASKDIHEPVFAMWKLLELDDRESLPLIRSIAEGPAGDYPFHQSTAQVICMLMEDPAEVIGRIRAHDHELMQWLTMAAQKLHTNEARAALEECARSAPDRECRRMCEGALAFWDSPE